MVGGDSRPLVLVTGANGFVGSAVVDALAQGYEVVALDRDAPPRPSAKAEFVALDVTSDDSVQAALKRVRTVHGDRIASVIHLAAFIDLKNEHDPRHEAVTVLGTARLLAALQSFDIGQFLFLSTMLVHAPSGHDRCIDEDSPLDDRFDYPAAKIRTERLLHERRGQVPVVVLRAAGVYDERCHAAFLDQQIVRIHQRRLTSHVYPGDLQAGQPYLHRDDLVDAIARVVDRRAELPVESTFIVGEADVMGYGDLQDAIGQGLHGEPWPTVQVPPGLASVGAWTQDKLLDEEPFIRPWMVDIASAHYRLDTSRASAMLGWTPRHSLRTTLPTMLEALRADPVGWYRTNHLDSSVVAAEAPEITARAPVAPPTPMQAPTTRSDAGGGVPSHADSMRSMHFDLLWTHWLNILLGAWLVASPVTFGCFEATLFSDAVRHVTADRQLADPALRMLMLGRSDLVCGGLVMLFGALSLSPRCGWAQWANAGVGIWILFAPLVFWAPSAAVYANDTMVGALVIAFAVLVPMMPGMRMAGMMDTSDLPPGWSYSPSTYLQRLPIIALGALGFMLARVLTAYQLGHIDAVWEPFFAGTQGLNGTETIVTSSVSKAWPIPDAGLGGVAYVFEVLMGAMGDRRRWRTMPWMVAMFGIVVVPLGFVSIWFIVIQPIVIGTWCTLCLATAVAMLVMIPLSLDELVAMGQYLAQSHRRGEPFWATFLGGGAQPAGQSGKQPGFDAPIAASIANATRGVTLPWTLVACTLLGAALMFTRVFFDSVPPLANSDHLTGALIVTCAVLATAEVARPLRFVNVAFGLWLMASGWALGGGNKAAAGFDTIVGALVIVLSLPRGRLGDARYGSWTRFVV